MTRLIVMTRRQRTWLQTVSSSYETRTRGLAVVCQRPISYALTHLRWDPRRWLDFVPILCPYVGPVWSSSCSPYVQESEVLGFAFPGRMFSIYTAYTQFRQRTTVVTLCWYLLRASYLQYPRYCCTAMLHRFEVLDFADWIDNRAVLHNSHHITPFNIWQISNARWIF